MYVPINNHVNLDLSIVKKEHEKEFSKYEWRAKAIATCVATIFSSMGVASLVAATSLASFGVVFVVALPIFAVLSALGFKYFEEKTHFWGNRIAPIVVLEDVLKECNEALAPFEKKGSIPEVMLPDLAKRAAVYCQLAVHGQVDKVNKAKTDLAPIYKAYPDCPQVLAIQGEIFRLEKNYKESNCVLDQALKNNFDDYYALTSQAELVRQSADRLAAIKKFEEVDQIHPDDPYVLDSLAALRATSVWERCRDYLERSFFIKTIPNRVLRINYSVIVPKEII